MVAGVDQARLVGVDDRLNAISQSQFHQYPGDMRLDGRLAHGQCVGDLAVAQPGGQATEDLELPWRELVELIGRASAGSCGGELRERSRGPLHPRPRARWEGGVAHRSGGYCLPRNGTSGRVDNPPQPSCSS